MSYVICPIRTWNAGAWAQKRAAVLTVSPSAVYYRRLREPMLPTTAGPVLMPIPQRIGGSPLARSFCCSSGARLMQSYAQRIASRADRKSVVWEGVGDE